MYCCTGGSLLPSFFERLVFLRGLGAMAGASPAEAGCKGSCTKKDRLYPRLWQSKGYPKKNHSSSGAGRAQMSPGEAGKLPAIMARPQTACKAAPACRSGQSRSGKTSRGPHRADTREQGPDAGVSSARSGCEAGTSAGGGAAAML